MIGWSTCPSTARRHPAGSIAGSGFAMLVRMWKRSLGVIHVPKPESGISAASGTARWTIRRPVLGAWAQTRARKAGCAASSASGIPARIARRVRSVDMGDTLPLGATVGAARAGVKGRRSGCRVAAVDGERHAGHERRLVAREIEDRRGDLLRLADAAERMPPHRALPPAGVGEERRRHRRLADA